MRIKIKCLSRRASSYQVNSSEDRQLIWETPSLERTLKKSTSKKSEFKSEQESGAGGIPKDKSTLASLHGHGSQRGLVYQDWLCSFGTALHFTANS